MTLKEKVFMFVGADNWHSRPAPRLGIPSLKMTDGPHGTRTITSVEDDHNGLPATCFPTATAMAATWNPALVEKVGEALGIETRAKGCDILLGPAVNIHRTPLCGRNFEYFSEDPFLTGRMAVAYIKGVQSQGIGTSLKHFAANNSEFERMTISSEIDERTLREIYLPAFKAAVQEAEPWTVMCSYNRINGVYASENHRLLTEILKEEWGFKGFVVSDWGAVHNRPHAAAAGLDLEMPGSDKFPEALFKAVRRGKVSRKLIDDKVRRILTILEKADAFEHSKSVLPETTDTPQMRQLALQAACEAVTLLKNQNNLLPLHPDKVHSVAVIGAFADQAVIQGDGSSRVTPYHATSPLEGLQLRAPQEVKLVFAPGCRLENKLPVLHEVDAALEAARTCDMALVFAGLPDKAESEGFDRENLDLPGDQNALIEKVAAANPYTVVVLQNGSPVTMPWIEQVEAVVEGWYTGQESGEAIAAVLFGDVNPSGKLPMTFPVRLEDTPAFLNYPGEHGQVRYGEGLFVGYRYYDKKDILPLFPFGHGLSYTSFAYRDLQLSQIEINLDGTLEFTLEVENTGALPGKETVQVYVHDIESSLVRPLKELKTFQKVELQPGEKRSLRFALTAKDLAFYSPSSGGWLTEPGEFEILVGSSSRDIRLRGTFTLKFTDGSGNPLPGRLNVDTKLHKIFKDPQGKNVLAQFAGEKINDPRIHMAMGMTLRQIAKILPEDLPVPVLEYLDLELRKIV
jgi:beta-glucosidase